MKDAAGRAGMEIESPIHDFPNFEHLEFQGSQDKKLQPFLKQMREWAEKTMEKD